MFDASWSQRSPAGLRCCWALAAEQRRSPSVCHTPAPAVASSTCLPQYGSFIVTEPPIKGSLYPANIIALILQCSLSKVANVNAGISTSHDFALLAGEIVFKPSGLPQHARSPAYQLCQRGAALPLAARAGFALSRGGVPCPVIGGGGSMLTGFGEEQQSVAWTKRSAARHMGHSKGSSEASIPLDPVRGSPFGSRYLAHGEPAQFVVLKNVPEGNEDARAERRACCVLQLLRAQGRTQGLLIPYGYLDLRLGQRVYSSTVMQLCCGGTLHDLLYARMPRVPVREGLSHERVRAIQREAWLEPEFIDRCLPRMPVELIRDIARQLLLGLHTLHSQSLAHYDIKPENIGWGYAPDGSIKVFLLDWTSLRHFDAGLARVQWGKARGNHSHSHNHHSLSHSRHIHHSHSGHHGHRNQSHGHSHGHLHGHLHGHSLGHAHGQFYGHSQHGHSHARHDAPLHQRQGGLVQRLARSLLRDGMPGPAMTQAYGPWQAVEEWPCQMPWHSRRAKAHASRHANCAAGNGHAATAAAAAAAAGGCGGGGGCGGCGGDSDDDEECGDQDTIDFGSWRPKYHHIDWQALDDPKARRDLHKEMQLTAAGELYDRLCLAQLLATLVSGMVPYQYEDICRPPGWQRQHLYDPWASRSLDLCIRLYKKLPRLPPHAEGRSPALESLIDILRSPHTALEQPPMTLEWLVKHHPFFQGPLLVSGSVSEQEEGGAELWQLLVARPWRWLGWVAGGLLGRLGCC